MVYKNYDSEEVDPYSIEGQQYDEDFSDSDEISSYDDDDDTYFNNQDSIVCDNIHIRPIHMKQLKLGRTVVCVFSNGALKTGGFETTVRGLPLAGTPFRVFTVEWDHGDFRTFMMHEIIWRAFHGPPPQGWEVRHKPEYTIFPRKVYSNALHHLTITPVIVEKLPLL
jgi:hypothetical protein